MTYNVSFATRLESGTLTDMEVYYSANGSASSVACASNITSPSSIWKKVNCTFKTPASGITANNALMIRQASGGTSRTFYIDNLSVTLAADVNYATDGSVNDGDNFASNWLFAGLGGGSATRNTSDGEDASEGVAEVGGALGGAFIAAPRRYKMKSAAVSVLPLSPCRTISISATPSPLTSACTNRSAPLLS